MNRIQKSDKIGKILDELYPDTPVPLNHSSSYTLLVAVMLSAQTTDLNVNNVTKNIYSKYYKPEHFVKLGRKKIEKLIKSLGFFRNKAKSVYLLSKQLIEKHGGKVPKNFKDLENLQGVGHKTASVVMSQGFGYPAFPVDTHIHRLAQRWGLSEGKNVEQVERNLKALWPEETWNIRHLQIIFFGREFCPSRNHILAECPICGWAASKKRIREEARR